MKVTINVTAEDIDKGVPHSACKCAVFLATSRVLPSLASLGAFSFWFLRGNDRISVRRAGRVNDLIDQLDSGQNVRPFTFILDVPGSVPVVTP